MTANNVAVEAYAVVRDVSGRNAWVEPEHRGCGRCHEPGGCGAQTKADLACLTPRRVQVFNAVGARVGDRVRIQTDMGTVAYAASLGYVMPLCGMLLGALFAQLVSGAEPFSVLGALVGGGAGSMLARSRSSASSLRLPLIVAVVAQDVPRNV